MIPLCIPHPNAWCWAYHKLLGDASGTEVLAPLEGEHGVVALCLSRLC